MLEKGTAGCVYIGYYRCLSNYCSGVKEMVTAATFFYRPRMRRGNDFVVSVFLCVCSGCNF